MSRFPARRCIKEYKTILFRKIAKRKLQPTATILVALAISIPISAQTITTFDAPGVGTGAFQGTFGGGLTPNGTS